MKNVLLFIVLLTTFASYSQDTLKYSSFIDDGITHVSTNVIVYEYLDSDDYIIDIYGECDTVNLASSDFKKNGKILTLIVDENPEEIQSVFISEKNAFIFYIDGKRERVTQLNR